MKTLQSLFIIGLTVVIWNAPKTSHATTIVKWGGNDMVSANQDLNLPTPTNTNPEGSFIRTWKGGNTSSYDPISPTSGYTGTPFYGILQTNSDTAYVDFSETRVINDDGGDYIYLRMDPPTANNDSFNALIFFGLDSPVSFADEASMSLKINKFFSPAPERLARFAVLNNGEWYLSSFLISSSTSTIKTIDVSADTQWALWEDVIGEVMPIGEAPYPNTTSGTYNISGKDLTHVEAVGFFVYLGTDTTKNLARVTIEHFSVDVVPESSTAVSLLLGMGLLGTGMLVFRKRR